MLPRLPSSLSSFCSSSSCAASSAFAFSSSIMLSWTDSQSHMIERKTHNLVSLSIMLSCTSLSLLVLSLQSYVIGRKNILSPHQSWFPDQSRKKQNIWSLCQSCCPEHLVQLSLFVSRFDVSILAPPIWAAAFNGLANFLGLFFTFSSDTGLSGVNKCRTKKCTTYTVSCKIHVVVLKSRKS